MLDILKKGIDINSFICYHKYTTENTVKKNPTQQEEDKVKYYISFERNNVYQGNIYEADSEKAARAYFEERKPDAIIHGINEHLGSVKPGMPVVIVPAK